MKEILVIYHGNCTDGFGAAYAAWKKFGNKADYLPMIFGDPIPDLTNKEVYILDFSFSKEVYLDILKIAKKVVLLDHHKPAYKALCECAGCFFDLGKSGSVLAWEHFHPNIPVPKFMTYIQDGDLLQFKHPETKAFYRGINAIPKDFEIWQDFENHAYLDDIVKEGMTLRIFFDSQVQQIIENAKPVVLMGKEGIMVNATYIFATEIGEILAKRCGTYALIWYEESKKIKCSLRSVPEFDASEIALHFGGGGHPQSCAFTVNDLSSFAQLIEAEKLKQPEDMLAY